ncbi:Eukaryotic translation initiation factor 3 subunit J, partial [Linum perenne]
EEHIPSLILKEQPKSKWDDEDVDDNDIKESWEDEDEDKPLPVTKPSPEKVTKKPVAKPAKGKTVEPVKEEPPLDPVAEKLRQQRLVEEADYRNTKELFGSSNDEKNIDNFIPKSESDFVEYAELISNKLRQHEKSYHFIPLLKSVMRLSMTSLKAADAKDVASSITAIANEKLKAEKEANAGKKKTGWSSASLLRLFMSRAGGKKKQLHVDKPDDDMVVKGYDALDDYDFM